ncbi:hypothetical protein P0D69_32250 [Paraburkholderia sediminicola]|uniref:hypothetical protein n=1 Tax=Paraburkholderia sediminicola TaxID=458836 RepID=UPI0038BCB224
MAKHLPLFVVLTYIEDRQEFAVQAIDRARLAPVVAGTLGQPDIKQDMTVKQDPIERQ